MDISLRKQASSLVARLAAHLHNPLYRNGYALASSSVITAGIGMLYWILAARTYPPGLVGLNSAMISVMMLLGGIAQLNLADGAVRFPQGGKGYPSGGPVFPAPWMGAGRRHHRGGLYR